MQRLDISAKQFDKIYYGNKQSKSLPNMIVRGSSDNYFNEKYRAIFLRFLAIFNGS